MSDNESVSDDLDTIPAKPIKKGPKPAEPEVEDEEEIEEVEDEVVNGANANTDDDDESEDGETYLSLAQRDHPTAAPSDKTNTKPQQVSWSALPRKDQLILLTLARLSDPLTQTSLQAYMFYQLKSFDPSLPDSTIASQAGFLQAAFTGAQFLTAILWGRMADWDGMGRKRVILVGLMGTSIGALGFGFSQSFYMALFWRAVGGALNGNVGVMRTMISEIIREKKYQSRAFLLLPMTFNVGVIIGPILGGLLADPVKSYPGIFGEGGSIGGETGVWWMKKWPYALPNLVSACFIAMSAFAVILGLEETLDSLRDRRDLGLRLGSFLKRTVFCRRSTHNYQPLTIPSTDIELQPSPTDASPTKPKPKRKLPFSRIWTRNVIFVLIAHGMLACHVGTFNQLWFIFLSTPRFVPPSPSNSTTSANPTLHLPTDYSPHLPFTFTGGLSLPPPSIGTSLAILGVIGLFLQLILYPPLSFSLGTIKSYRLSLLLFPLSYLLAPFLTLVPTSSAPPHPADGPYFWAALVVVLSIQVLARTFALPATTILLNNASPHPSVLGTVHGIGQSVSSAMRTLGPVVGGWGYGMGLRNGVVGAVWWGMSCWAVLGVVAGGGVKEGDGHEVWLEGEEEGEEKENAGKAAR
ncbi:major facilitator superfamily domain-containing protein [Elsinoe ampelina]|uniref:Major facilitator superfamily domain-containing protein n=1 Tax=Elsinoe ampelina TaxID=302913 RepID=A0A6A6GDL9_9PEZI|nr:major facilitator superfamily domain-containing protein [Elsinoe ampelina]